MTLYERTGHVDLDHPGTGKVFYVNPSTSYGPAGDDDRIHGEHSLRPLKTLQNAIDRCVDRRGDRILVYPGTQTVTTAVLFNKQGITVEAMPSVGYSPRKRGEGWAIYGSHTDGPAALITKPCVIKGMGFVGSEAAGASVEIDCEDAGAWAGAWVHMFQCRFIHWGIAKAYALEIKGTADNTIEQCVFDGLWTGYTQAAIGLEDSGAFGVWNLTIKDNVFWNIGAGKYCIQLAAGTHFRQGLVEGNRNIGSALFFNAAGEAGDAVFVENYPGGATDGGSYSDTVGNLQVLGYDFAGNHYSE